MAELTITFAALIGAAGGVVAIGSWRGVVWAAGFVDRYQSLGCACDFCKAKRRVLWRVYLREHPRVPRRLVRAVFAAQPGLARTLLPAMVLKFEGGMLDGHQVDPSVSAPIATIWNAIVLAGEAWEHTQGDVRHAHHYRLDEERMVMVFGGVEPLPDDTEEVDSGRF